MRLVKEQPADDSQEEWLARERAHLSQVLYRYTPIVVDHAQGSYIYSVDGRRYLDFASGIAVTNLGHGHPAVVAAAKAQLDKVMHTSVVAHHQPAIELAERIAALAPGKLDKVFFANSGAEAVEGAIKLARYATGRPALIAFQGAFHGRTYGALSLTASKSYYRERYEPFLPGVYHVPYPYPFRNPTGTSEQATLDYVFGAIDELLDTRVPPRNIAAFIVEPVLGEGGYVVPPAEFMPRLRDLQRRLPAIGEVRGLGLMVGVELVKKDGSANKDLQKKVREVCLDSGMVVLSCGPHDNVLRLVPPLNLSQAELDEGWEILNAAFQEVAA